VTGTDVLVDGGVCAAVETNEAHVGAPRNRA